MPVINLLVCLPQGSLLTLPPSERRKCLLLVRSAHDAVFPGSHTRLKKAARTVCLVLPVNVSLDLPGALGKALEREREFWDFEEELGEIWG